MIGIPKPVALDVFPPDTGANKGGIIGHRYKPSNNDVRFKGAKEGGKNLRKCSICKKLMDQDFRNCPNNPNRKILNAKKSIKKTKRNGKENKVDSSSTNFSKKFQEQ